MKFIMTLCLLLMTQTLWAAQEANVDAAEVDTEYLEKINNGVEEINSQPSRTEITREKMEENPRNPAMVNSFESLDSAENKDKEKLKKRP